MAIHTKLLKSKSVFELCLFIKDAEEEMLLCQGRTDAMLVELVAEARRLLKMRDAQCAQLFEVALAKDQALVKELLADMRAGA